MSLARFAYAQSAFGSRECPPAPAGRIVIASGWTWGRETLLGQVEALHQRAADLRTQARKRPTEPTE